MSLRHVVFCLSIILGCGLANFKEGVSTLTLEHCLDKHHFEFRASIDIWQSNRTLITSKSAPPTFQATIRDSISFNDTQLEQLRNLGKQDQFYKIRVRTHAHHSPLSSVRANQLLKYALRDSIVLHMNNFGDVVALEYTVVPEPSEVTQIRTFTTALEVQSAFVGEKPKTPTRRPIKTNAHSKELDTNEKEPKTFFQKYWLYIVIAGVVCLVNLAVDPGAGGPNTERPASQ